MPTPNQKRMIKHINATVFKLLKDYHFDEITIQKICDIAEINRSTFYRYFQDKYDILFSLPDYIATHLFLQKNLFNNSSILLETIRKYLNIY